VKVRSSLVSYHFVFICTRDKAHYLGGEIQIGNCNNDKDCDKDLYCYKRFGGYALVPGCAGQGTYQFNYCFDPRDIPGYDGGEGGGGGGGGGDGPNNGGGPNGGGKPN
jgi:uncharacterized membrane protein YgcG